MDLKKSNNYKLAPAEIVGKIRKKPRNWFKLFLNSVGVLFLLVILALGFYRMWAYYSIFKKTPRSNVDLYIILDDQALKQSENWQHIIANYIEKNSNISPILWDSLLNNNKYYLSIYKNNEESPLKFLFYLPDLSVENQDLLRTLDIPFIYDGKYLLLNDTSYFEGEKNSELFDFSILNRTAIGSYNDNYFILYENEGEIVLDLPNIKADSNSYRSYVNYNERKEELYFASNRLKWKDLTEYLDFTASFSVPAETSIELAIFEKDNIVLGKDFTLVLKNLQNVDEFLKNLEYLFAYNNREILEVTLSDDSVIEEEVLNFEKFSWQDENFYKKILISENENLYFYSTLKDGDLILSSQFSEIENLENSKTVNLSHYDFMKSDFLSQLETGFDVNDYCQNWTLKYGSSLQISSCE